MFFITIISLVSTNFMIHIGQRKRPTRKPFCTVNLLKKYHWDSRRGWESSKKIHPLLCHKTLVAWIIMTAFLSETSCHALGPLSLRTLASLGQSAHSALTPNTHDDLSDQSTMAWGGGLFFVASLPFQESLWKCLIFPPNLEYLTASFNEIDNYLRELIIANQLTIWNRMP